VESRLRVLVFGEILWDYFGGRRELGGAPLNFAVHLARLVTQSGSSAPSAPMSRAGRSGIACAQWACRMIRWEPPASFQPGA